jgi:hypothetical protein
MFQFAIGYSLAKRFDTNLYFDHGFLEKSGMLNYVKRDFNLHIFKIDEKRASKDQINLFFDKPSILQVFKIKFGLANHSIIVKETQYHFSNTLFKTKKNYYLDGYWQSPLYFKGYENNLSEAFQFRDPLLSVSYQLQQSIISENSVCLQVRRGDFKTSDFHVLCTAAYYVNAINYFRNHIVNPSFYVFTDDEAWSKEIFAGYQDVCIVGAIHNGINFGNKFHLMSLCKHFIISNSTFGWWAAWLGKCTKKKVIAPTKWYSDNRINFSELIFPDWILMDNV